MEFIKKVISLIKSLIIELLEVNLSILTDLKSFRNKLVFFTCGLVFFIIWKGEDYRVSLAALGLLEFFLCYYFNNRKVKDASIVEKIAEKLK